jgi:hypothetical protein
MIITCWKCGKEVRLPDEFTIGVSEAKLLRCDGETCDGALIGMAMLRIEAMKTQDFFQGFRPYEGRSAFRVAWFQCRGCGKRLHITQAASPHSGFPDENLLCDCGGPLRRVEEWQEA